MYQGYINNGIWYFYLHIKILHNNLLKVLSEEITFSINGSSHKQITVKRFGAKFTSKTDKKSPVFVTYLFKKVIKYILNNWNCKTLSKIFYTWDIAKYLELS